MALVKRYGNMQELHYSLRGASTASRLLLADAEDVGTWNPAIPQLGDALGSDGINKQLRCTDIHLKGIGKPRMVGPALAYDKYEVECEYSTEHGFSPTFTWSLTTETMDVGRGHLWEDGSAVEQSVNTQITVAEISVDLCQWADTWDPYYVAKIMGKVNAASWLGFNRESILFTGMEYKPTYIPSAGGSGGQMRAAYAITYHLLYREYEGPQYSAPAGAAATGSAASQLVLANHQYAWRDPPKGATVPCGWFKTVPPLYQPGNFEDLQIPGVGSIRG